MLRPVPMARSCTRISLPSSASPRPCPPPSTTARCCPRSPRLRCSMLHARGPWRGLVMLDAFARPDRRLRASSLLSAGHYPPQWAQGGH